MEAMFVAEIAAEAGRLLGRTITPRQITALFYERLVPDALGPVVGGRRLVRPEALDAILIALRKRGSGKRSNSKKGEGSTL